LNSNSGTPCFLSPDDVFITQKLIHLCGRSAGYGVSVVAETTTGCLISADATVSHTNVDELSTESEKPELMSPEDLGEQVASMLLEEVAQGGVVDSTHQV
jgi:RNA 3'-terminal phosphate cyclase-like protein